MCQTQGPGVQMQPTKLFCVARGSLNAFSEVRESPVPNDLWTTTGLRTAGWAPLIYKVFH